MKNFMKKKNNEIMRKGPNTDPLPGQLGVQRMPSLGEQIKYPIKLIKIKHDAGSQRFQVPLLYKVELLRKQPQACSNTFNLLSVTTLFYLFFFYLL